MREPGVTSHRSLDIGARLPAWKRAPHTFRREDGVKIVRQVLWTGRFL